MEHNEFRPVVVKADGTKIAEKLRVRAHGKSSMTLLPDLYIVDIYNLPDEELAILSTAETLSVSHEKEGLLCYGEIDDIFSHQQEANMVTSVVLVDGKKFIKSRVSMTIGAGAGVKSTMATLLGGLLGAFMATDVRLICAQTFSGRTAEYISVLARAVNARAFYTHGAVIVTEKGRADSYLTLETEDVIDEPSYAEGVVIVRTKMKSFAVGTIISYKGSPYRLVSQICDADNKDGMWRLELTLVRESDLDANGMEGG